MRNKALARLNGIPYYKILRPLGKTFGGCIALKQLDYWTDIQGGEFYKFLNPTYKLGEDGKPVKDAAGNLVIEERYGYKTGDSWTEELGCTEDEFMGAFSQFGIRYASKKKMQEAHKAGNIFFLGEGVRDALYASCYDRQTHQTWYFRNDDLLDDLLDELLINESSRKNVDGKPEKQRYSNSEFQFLHQDNSGFSINTEITPETTAEITPKTNTTPAAARVNDGRLPLDCFDDEDCEAAAKAPSEPASSTATHLTQPSHAAPAACGNVEKPGRGKSKPAEPWDVEGFDAFYAQYPIHKGRSDAQGAWNKLRPNAELKATIMHDLAVRKAEDADWLRGFGIKWPQGYLNQKCWTDEIRRIKPGQPPPGPRKGFVSKAEEEEARRKVANQHLMSIINGQEVV